MSAQDKPLSLNLQHGSCSLYQTLYFPAPFLFSQPQDCTSPFLLLFLSRPFKKWKDRGKKNPPHWATLAKGHTPSNHYPSLWFLPIWARQRQLLGCLLCCLPCYSEYTGMTTGVAEASLFNSPQLYSVRQSTQRPPDVWHKNTQGQTGYSNDENVSISSSFIRKQLQPWNSPL